MYQGEGGQRCSGVTTTALPLARSGRDETFPPDRDSQLLASLRTTPLIVPAPILTSCASALQALGRAAATAKLLSTQGASP
jgi:hypothetical protein